MKQHRYHITVDYLADADGNPPVGPTSLAFDVGNHDNLLAIVARLEQRGDFDSETAKAFGIGLKLFGEVILTHKDHPLFTEMRPQFMAFMKALKSGTPKTA